MNERLPALEPAGSIVASHPADGAVGVPPPSGFRRAPVGLAKVAVATVVTLGLAALLAPLLAGNRPIAMRRAGEWTFPAISGDGTLDRIPAAHYRTLDLEPGDWMLMPPVPFDPYEIDWDHLLEPPSRRHLLGTDEQGRDLLARLIHGARVSVVVGFIPLLVYLPVGVVLGTLAGWFGGRTDLLVSRVIEVVICFPDLFLILAIIAYLGPGLGNLLVVFGVLGWTGVARVVRGETLKLRNRDYVVAALALGNSRWRVMWRHILPNAFGPVMVLVIFRVAGMILTESGLSFLGLGVQPPTPSWGSMLAAGKDYIAVPGCGHLTLFPGLAIFGTVLSYNLIGEWVRDAMDPTLREPEH